MADRHSGSRARRSHREDVREMLDRLLLSDTDDDEPVYVISVAADLVGVHAQTLRHYERAGLIEPARSDGGIRLFSSRDVRRLRAIALLTGDLGVNLAGVEVIFDLRTQVADLRAEVRQLRSDLRAIRGYLLEDLQARDSGRDKRRRPLLTPVADDS